MRDQLNLVASSIAIVVGNRRAAWIALAGALVVIAAVELPALGVPCAAAVATYAWVRLCKPHKVLRGRTLSPHQQQRAALIGAVAVLASGALFSGTICALHLANTLEGQLQESLISAHRRGELRPGQLIEQCKLACARAVVVETPDYNTPGIARLNGYTVHNHLIYGWRNSAVPPDDERASFPKAVSKPVAGLDNRHP